MTNWARMSSMNIECEFLEIRLFIRNWSKCDRYFVIISKSEIEGLLKIVSYK